MMTSRGVTVACLSCGKTVIPYPVPYGMAWVCACGHWMVLFSIDKEVALFQTGNEESAIQYISKFMKKLGVDKNV